MYAIVEVGGKQYTVQEGDVIEVEKQDASEGKEIALKKVLLVADSAEVKIGQPYVKEAGVTAQVLKSLKAPKVISYKYERRKSRHWTKGHRQQLTELKIKEIKIG